MKFPYGMCDFYKIITDEYFYVDRTDRIPLIEDAGEHLLFLRPRRFGKSLLLSVLENYYDLLKADEFERLFGHLAIGQNPTSKHNQYFVMNWDFSAVDPQGQPEQIQRALHNHINGCIEQFKARYRDVSEYDILLDPHDALRSFQSVLAAIQRTPFKLYLLIDEYDNFANEVMMSGQSASTQRYQSLLYGEGALKTIFKAVKSATKGLGLDRAFITGVSPVVMSDITSGHNIAENISLDPEFNKLCGFWESEVAETLEQLVEACGLSAEKTKEALTMMQTFYDGYQFMYEYQAPSGGQIYNPTLVLYFLKHFQKRCKYPRDILDSNLAMDKGKITYISGLPNGKQVVVDAVSDEAPLRISRLADRFGVEDILYTTKDRTFMVSLLYYFGVLTLTNQRTDLGELILSIPNLVIRKLYIERLQEMLLPDFQDKDDAQEAVRTFYQTGDIHSLCDFIEQCYFKVFDNRDYRWANELTVKTAFLTLLFNDTFYIMDSEPALERTYADLTMIVRPDMRQYQLLDFLLEFKYVELKKNKLRGEQVRQMNMEDLKALDVVQEKLENAKSKLTEYRQTLNAKYGDMLHLHIYSVVAVGFDRLVWEELQ